MNFSMFSCSLFSFSWLGKPHVEENSRKEDRRRACGSKTEAYLFGFKKHMSVRQTSSLGSDALMSWGIRSWIQILFKEALGNRCKVLKTILKGRGLWTDTLVTRYMFTRTVILHSLLELHSHIHHATRVAQDPHENTSPSCASCLMP